MFWPETSLQALHKVNNKRRGIKQRLNSDFQLSSKLWQSLEQLLHSVTLNKGESTQTVTGNSINCWFIKGITLPDISPNQNNSPPFMQPKGILSCSQELTPVPCLIVFLSQGSTLILAVGSHRQIRYAFFRVTSVYRRVSLHAQFMSPFCSPIKARIHVHN